MKTIFAVVLLASFVGNIFAGPELIIKQKAKDIANQNNAQQGQPPQYPPAQSPPGKPAAPTPDPVPLTPEQQAFLRVANDLAVVKTNDVNKLAADLTAMTYGTSKPPAIVQKLAKDLTTALAGKMLAPAQRTRITQDIRTVLNTENISAAQMDSQVASVQAILKTAGADAARSAVVGDDLKASHPQK